jgi:hypothetical protein
MAGRIAYYGNIVTNGLVLDLDAAKRDSYPGTGTTWRDIAGGIITGSLTNGPTYSTSGAGSIVFDGVDDIVSFSSLRAYGGTDPHNYTAWIKFNDGSSYKWILNNGAGSNGTSLIIYGSKLGFFYNGGAAVVQANTTLSTGTWYHLSVSYLGETTVKMYVNGALDATKNTLSPTAGVGTSTWSATNQNPRLGAWFNGSFPFNGSIATTQIYNRALSDAEVLQNYNATKGRYQ